MMTSTMTRALSALFVAAALAACGGGQTNAITVSVTPSAQEVTAGGSVTFQAQVSGTSDSRVTWSVREPAGGVVSELGVYTAPSVPGTYTVVATSVADSTKSGAAAVTVKAATSNVAITISPESAAVEVGQTVGFTAEVTGTTNTAINWSVEEGANAGTIDANGLYTAPATAGTYHVIARSAADSTKQARATVNVTTAAVVMVAITPTSAALSPGQTQQFLASVAGNANTAVTWSIQQGAAGGTIDANGLYTAPATPGTYHVVATSVADTSKSATATVTVAAPNVVVALTPTSAALQAGQTQQFVASVSGTTNTAVTWSIQEGNAGGTISSSGLYTAPANSGTFHVVATSVANPSATATATVTVTAPTVVVSITPTTASLLSGQTQQFTATVTGSSNTAVTWSIQQGASGGTIDANGLYTAPATGGTYNVIATSVADGTKSAMATVTVTQPVSVAISPTTASVFTGGTQQFTATVSGSTNTAVTWSIQEGASGGSITTSGLYTAPATAGTYHVVATSAADNTKSAIAAITVSAPVVAVSINPNTASVVSGGTQQFTATVTGTPNTGVTWSIQEGAAGGTVDANGLYTAPANATGTFHVVATSVADTTKSAVAAVNVTAQPTVAVAVSPQTVSINTGATQQFTATVTGSTNTAVTWSVQEGASGGTVSTSGLYTAPSTAGTYHVIATSVADPTKSATATVTVTAPAVVSISVSPTTVTLEHGATQQFTATVTGSTNTAVSWSVQQAQGGTITSAGLYTAPAASGVFTVIATSAADPTKTATATVTVIPTYINISGTVSYSGTKTGRIYLIVDRDNYSGTSIASPGAFTVRGVQASAGSVNVYAYMDVLGNGIWSDAASPWGYATVTVGTADLTNVAITLTDLPASTSVPAPTAAPSVIAGDGAAYVYFDRVYDAQGYEVATHYRVFYSTTANPGPANNLGSVTVRAGSSAMVKGLTNGTSYYFSYTAVDEGVQSAASPAAGPLAVQAPTGGLSISGTVTFSGYNATGPLYVLAWSQTGAVLRSIANPTASQAYTLNGITTGTWYVYAMLDQGDDGELAAVDPTSFSTEVVATVASSNLTNVNVALPTGQLFATVSTQHGKWSTGERYQVVLYLWPNAKQPVKATVNSGPNIIAPVDLGVSTRYSGYHYTNLLLDTVPPQVNDTYSVTVTYADATTETLSLAVSGVMGTPTPTQPVTTGTTSPTFTWTPPATLPASYTYEIWVVDASGNTVWSQNNIPAGTTSIQYNADGTATQATLTAGQGYGWYIYIVDDKSNAGWGYASFTAQ